MNNTEVPVEQVGQQRPRLPRRRLRGNVQCNCYRHLPNVSAETPTTLCPAPACPRYERLALRLIGINEFVFLAEAPAGARLAACATHDHAQ